MSPETNVKEKLTVTAAPPPAALASSKKGATKKRSETENLIDGHAAGIKTDRLSDEQKSAQLTTQGRKAGVLACIFCLFLAFWTLTKYGRFLHADLVVSQGETPLIAAYHNLHKTAWFFGYFTRTEYFRLFNSLAVVCLFSAIVIPRQFGRFWMGLGHVLGTVVTPIVISLMFFIGFTPLALVFRVLGVDPLRRSKHEGTYWLARDRRRDTNHFERRF